MRHSSSSRRRRLLGLALTGVLAASAVGCGGGSSSSGGGGDTLVFGASADPAILDGPFVSDGESLRVIRQVFEGLVTTKEGSTDIKPALAKSWDVSPDGKTYTFHLRDGVKFQDGTDFNADAVCYNFDRWYHFTGILQSPSVTYYYQTVFGGFAKNEDKSLPTSLFSSCDAKDKGTAVITLSHPSSTFLTALSLPALSMASPTALKKYHADSVSGSGDSPKFNGSYGTEHPTGTGPFTFDSWTKGDKLVLTRNDNYWGKKAKVQTLIFRPIADGPARKQALEAGDIDGYDLVDPSDVASLKKDGFDILRRPAFNVGYIGFNQAMPPMDNPKIRQAIAYAVNRQKLVKTKYPAGAQVAKEFMPPQLWGYNPNVPDYSYDPAKAKKLIAQSGVKNPTLQFWYPSNVSRPYMPDPAGNFQLIKADLEAVGFKVKAKTAPWTPDYIDAVQGGKAQMYIIGWTGDFGDPDNFIGTFFQKKAPDWGFSKPDLFKKLDAAEAETDQNKRAEMYKQINAEIMQFLPGLPYVHTQPALAFKPSVKGFVPSPVNNEDFNTVYLKK